MLDLKADISKKKIREIVSGFMSGLEIPELSQCRVSQGNGKHTLLFSAGDFDHKASLLMFPNNAVLMIYQRRAGMDREYAPTGCKEIGFIETEVK